MTNVTWDTSNSSNVTISGNTITGTGTGWSGIAKGTDIITVYDYVEFTLSGSGINGAFGGLGKDPLNSGGNPYSDIEFAVYYKQPTGEWKIRELGVNKLTLTGISGTATAKIERTTTGGVKYYIDGTLRYTSTVTETGSLYPHAVTEYAGGCTMTRNTRQRLGIYFYPTSNINISQQLKVEFYPTGNTQNASSGGSVNQQLKVEFYPTGNEQTSGTTTNSGWKWWVGMRGKKRYGNKGIRRLKI